MNIEDVAKLFDTQEKWEAFIELCNQRDKIKYHWFNLLKVRIESHFKEKKIDGWSCKFIKPGIDDVRWFLNEFGDNSICLALEANKISVWCNDAYFESAKARELLGNEHKELYNRLIDIVSPSDERGSYLISENLKFFSLGTSDSLAWYAQSQTDDFLTKIVDIVEKFTTPEITILLSDLNRSVRKKT